MMMGTGGIARAHRLLLCSSGNGMLTISNPGSQDPSALGSPGLPYPRHRPHPARWPIPRQACRTSQDPRPGCSPRHRSLQGQRRSLETRQLQIRYCHVPEGRARRCRPGQDRRGRRTQILRSRHHQGQGQRGCLLQAGREATGMRNPLEIWGGFFFFTRAHELTMNVFYRRRKLAAAERRIRRPSTRL